MGRGVSAGGGQSSLDYLFVTDEAANNNAPAADNVPAADIPPAASSEGQPADDDKQVPPGDVPGYLKNNYHRAEGQNCGNFVTDRPSTKVHAAPGGGSSLNYLFGGPPPENK
ncbi:protein SPIRAL1-like 2 isoform X2 [Arachis duranensis]|uniref:Protein SPIRAL1-like 2 isoform X2 n=1 Tax=Arachis duranensis TaxID=130453 RepID=A0A9C6WUL8_ARADU|nr:protein SPIRAL1-like 2 isoform X2 [Arachis duranensis]